MSEKLTEQYRSGFIDGALAGGVDLDYALWAIENDMNGARVLRDDAQGDPEMLANVKYFINEARMWNQIARRIRHWRPAQFATNERDEMSIEERVIAINRHLRPTWQNQPGEEPTVRSLHNEAMEHAQKGMALFVTGHSRELSDDEKDTLIAHYHTAWDLECQAISVLMESGHDADKRQPTERILRRSAVSCLMSAINATKELYAYPSINEGIKE